MSNEVYSSLRWLATSRAIAQAVAWASTILVVRLLTPADYGLVTMATIFSSYLLFLGDFGVGPGLISRRERDVRTLEAAHGVSVAGSFVFFALIASTAPLVAIYFDDDDVTRLVQVSALMFVAVGISTVPRAMLSIDMRFKEISIASMVSSLCTTLVTVALAYAGFGPWALVLGTVTGAFCLGFVMMMYVGAVRLRWELTPLRGLTRFSAYTLAERSVWYWYTQIDSLIVGRLLGQSVLGILSVGKDIAAAPISKVVEVTNQVALPVFARLQDDRKTLAENYRKSIRLSAAIGFPTLWGLALTAQDLVPLLLGPKWVEVTLVVVALATVMPLRFTSALSAVLLLGIGRADQAFRNMLATLIAVAVLLVIGSQWGLAGISAAWVIAIPFAFLVALRSACSHLPIGAIAVLKDMARSAMPAIFMAACCVSVRFFVEDVDSWIRLALTVLVGVCSWILGMVWMARPFFDEVVQAGRDFLGKRRAPT